MSIIEKRKGIFFLLLLSFVSVFWCLSIENAFCYDDLAWLDYSIKNNFSDIFSFFPVSAYNDRPIGIMFIKAMYEIWGLDYTKHHAILIIIHLLSVYLSYIVFGYILSGYYEDENRVFYGSIIGSGFFGIWPIAHIAVQWDAAIFDLLGTLLILISCWSYIKYRTIENKKKYTYAFLFLFFYYLSIRTKEMFIIFPILIMLFELEECIRNKIKYKLDYIKVLSFIEMIVFLVMIFYRKKQGSITNDVNNAYYQSFNPIKMFINLVKYCQMLFDLQNPFMSYEFSYIGATFTILFFTCICLGLFNFIKGDFKIIVIFIAIGVSISTVLPMVNQQHDLYLYFPTLLFGLLIAIICNMLNTNLIKYVCYVLLLLFLLANYSTGYNQEKNNWLANCYNENKVLEQLQEFESPIEGTSVYVIMDSTEDYSPFYYGNGDVIRVAYGDNTLDTYLVTDIEGIDLQKPYWILSYKNNNLEREEINTDRELCITEYYLYDNEDGSITISIVPDIITDIMNIYVDNKKIDTIVGESFISGTVSNTLLDNKDSIAIYITDIYGTESNSINIELK